MEICWLTTAEKEKDNLIDYIYEKSGSIEQAIAVGDSVEEHVDHLADHPKMGNPGRRQGTYELVHPKYGYVVIYQLRNRRVEIINVLRGQQIEEPPA